MYPIFFKFYSLTFYSYGFFVALGAILGMLYLKYQAPKISLSIKHVYDLVFYSMLGGLIGGRILYVLCNIHEFYQFPDVFKVWEGGLIFYGGLSGGLIVCIILFKLWHIPFFAGMDVIMPGAVLAHAVGRLGCLFAGCCYGAKTGLPWGITFTNQYVLAPTGIKLHPTQVYAFLGNVLIFLVLHYRLKTKRFDGDVVLWYMMLYGIFRFLIEFLRADPRGPVLLSLTLMQYISLGMAGIGAVVYIKDKKIKN